MAIARLDRVLPWPDTALRMLADLAEADPRGARILHLLTREYLDADSPPDRRALVAEMLERWLDFLMPDYRRIEQAPQPGAWDRER